MRKQRRAGRLPRLVVLALGTDGRVKIAQINEALRIAGPDRILGLVTPHELGGGAGFDASVMRKAASKHRARIVLFDWVRLQPRPQRLVPARPCPPLLYRRRGLRPPARQGDPLLPAGHDPPWHPLPALASAPGWRRWRSAASAVRAVAPAKPGAAPRVECQGLRATIVGSSKPDRISGTNHRDVIAARAGNDEVHGKGGNDVICAGRGMDFAWGGTGWRPDRRRRQPRHPLRRAGQGQAARPARGRLHGRGRRTAT